MCMSFIYSWLYWFTDWLFNWVVVFASFYRAVSCWEKLQVSLIPTYFAAYLHADVLEAFLGAYMRLVTVWKASTPWTPNTRREIGYFHVYLREIFVIVTWCVWENGPIVSLPSKHPWMSIHFQFSFLTSFFTPSEFHFFPLSHTFPLSTCSESQFSLLPTSAFLFFTFPVLYIGSKSHCF